MTWTTDAEHIRQPFQRIGARTASDGFGVGRAIFASIADVHAGALAADGRNRSARALV